MARISTTEFIKLHFNFFEQLFKTKKLKSINNNVKIDKEIGIIYDFIFKLYINTLNNDFSMLKLYMLDKQKRIYILNILHYFFDTNVIKKIFINFKNKIEISSLSKNEIEYIKNKINVENSILKILNIEYNFKIEEKIINNIKKESDFYTKFDTDLYFEKKITDDLILYGEIDIFNKDEKIVIDIKITENINKIIYISQLFIYCFVLNIKKSKIVSLLNNKYNIYNFTEKEFKLFEYQFFK